MNGLENQDKIPVFGKINNAYTFVMVFLALQIVIYYLITRLFS